MSNEKSSSSSSGIGFFSLLAVVFITLKLLGKITWSWWWVLSPLWGPLAVIIIIILAVLAVAWFLRWVHDDRSKLKDSLSNYRDKLIDKD